VTNSSIILFDMRISCRPELRYYVAGLILTLPHNTVNSVVKAAGAKSGFLIIGPGVKRVGFKP
jgi:hypothetical protein